jgi:hypothetical protein
MYRINTSNETYTSFNLWDVLFINKTFDIEKKIFSRKKFINRIYITFRNWKYCTIHLDSFSKEEQSSIIKQVDILIAKL